MLLRQNNFTLSELQAYALDKNMPITEKSKNLTKKQLLNNIKLKIEQVDYFLHNIL